MWEWDTVVPDSTAGYQKSLITLLATWDKFSSEWFCYFCGLYGKVIGCRNQIVLQVTRKSNDGFHNMLNWRSQKGFYWVLLNHLVIMSLDGHTFRTQTLFWRRMSTFSFWAQLIERATLYLAPPLPSIDHVCYRGFNMYMNICVNWQWVLILVWVTGVGVKV